MYYNEELADSQGLTDEDRLELDELYLDLNFALDNPEVFDSVEEAVRQLEFELQRVWRFTQDPKFHRYQLEIKGCTCPRLDNFELFGHTASRYITSDCPWHWRKV